MTLHAETSDLSVTELRATLGALDVAQRATMTTFDPGREETLPRRRRPRAAATTEFARALDVLNLTQLRAAQLFGVNVRHIRRWGRGDRRVPRGVGIVLRLLAAGAVSIDQVERAAVLIPARTNGNGGTKATPPAPLRVAPEPEPAPAPKPEPCALARTETPPVGTAVQIYKLTPTSCRWPLGDPGSSDFCFCCNPVTRRPYCERHRRVAYLPSIDRRPSALSMSLPSARTNPSRRSSEKPANRPRRSLETSG